MTHLVSLDQGGGGMPGRTRVRNTPDSSEMAFGKSVPGTMFEILFKGFGFAIIGKGYETAQFHGLNLEVCGDLPALCSASRCSRFVVMPTYLLPG